MGEWGGFGWGWGVGGGGGVAVNRDCYWCILLMHVVSMIIIVRSD